MLEKLPGLYSSLKVQKKSPKEKSRKKQRRKGTGRAYQILLQSGVRKRDQGKSDGGDETGATQLIPKQMKTMMHLKKSETK